MTALARLMIFASAVLYLQAQTNVEAAAAEHAARAQDAEQRNDFATAVREYQTVVKLVPESPELQSNLGVALYFDHELPKAITVFRKAIALKSDLLAPHLFMGLAWFRLSNPDAAVPELETAIHLNPSDVLSHTWLGYAYVAQSRTGPALKEFRAANRLDPTNIDVWYALGQTYLQVGKEATTQLLATAPDGARAWQLAAEQAEMQGNRQQALDDYRNALERRPDLLELQQAFSRLDGEAPVPLRGAPRVAPTEDSLYLEAHDAEQQARAAFEEIGKLAPDSYRAHQILAESMTAQGRLEEANAEYRIVLRSKTDLPGIHDAIGMNLLRNGKLDGALKEFNAEITVQPRSATAHTHAGEVLLLMGNDDEARRMLTSAQSMDRPPVDVFRLLGKLDLRRKDYHSAVEALTRYLSVRKDDARAFYLLSKAYAGLGDRDQASRALASFEETSRDVKARSRAQTELSNFSHPDEQADERADVARVPER